MLRTLFAALLLAAAFASPAKAEPQTFQFDKLHTQILFFVNHLGFSHSNGKFTDFDGNFTFDEANPAAGSVEVIIKTDSINMDDDTWEDHLKAADMFNVEKFPTMTFKSTSVTLKDDKTGQMNGDLTLLGVTKPVTLDVVKNKCGEHPFSKKFTCGFDAKTTIKRSDFGMTKSVPMVGDDVNILITVEGSVQ